MQAVRNDGAGGRGIQYVPKSGEYQNVVVWLHGLGDTADGWASMMPELRLENTKFILPTAKSRPIALNGGSPMPGTSFVFSSLKSHALTLPIRQDGVISTASLAAIAKIARALTSQQLA